MCANSAHAAERRLRVVLGAFGDPGHAFPIIALGRALAARGHDVTIQTWKRWREAVEARGIRVRRRARVPGLPHPGTAAEALRGGGPRRARRRAGARGAAPRRRRAPTSSRSRRRWPPRSSESRWRRSSPTSTRSASPACRPTRSAPASRARPPGARSGGDWTFVTERGLQQGRARAQRHPRRASACPRSTYVHGGISRAADARRPPSPSSSIPRALAGLRLGRRPADVGAAERGRRAAARATRRSCSIAPSTAQDPEHRMLRRGAARASPTPRCGCWPPGTAGRRLAALAVPDNARLVEWLSYSRTMPHCDVVVCHAGHGTLVRALSSGCVVVACPAVGDMNENAARLDWAGLGVRVPRRFVAARPLRLAVERALGDTRCAIARASAGRIGRRARCRRGGRATYRATSPRPERGGEARIGREAPGVGLEPTTSRLTAAHSAN